MNHHHSSKSMRFTAKLSEADIGRLRRQATATHVVPRINSVRTEFPTPSWTRWARAAWVRSIAPAIQSWTAMSR
jgi:hypothetical protein